ncbi:UNVERIFIED_CONTAM: hypothetical protein FKN15_013888 [Acipenser sinensis]
MSESKAKRVEIKDVDGQTLTKLVDYVYTAEIEVTEENVQVMMVVGGQAPKAIRSVECYDFQEDRWYQVAELPSRRCRSGVAVIDKPL